MNWFEPTHRRHFAMSSLSAPLLLVASLSLGADGPSDAVDYLRDIKPLLASRCYACHGAIKQKGSLRLDTAALVREGGSSGPAVAGKAADSLLLKRILGQDGMSRMPPDDAGEALKPPQVALIRRWIEQGASGPKDEKAEADPREHWAFRPPARPAVPAVKRTAWVRNPVDAFVAREHEARGLVPQGPAEKGVLLRRVYLDLIGLPPTREELLAFVHDPATDAYEAAVDRLLASPQYSERWGRHWMDVWRYSDWWGLGAELRNSQKHMWHWRDWIVESLQRDKGYDRMVLEMLAADELFPTDTDALRGTGFLARHYFKFNRTTWLDETIEHTSKAFLGLTMNCSKCHDHKYDPISQVDYYRFRAFFEPYQIRLDEVPGETDFEKDGVPRVFDCNLEAPTYLHIRGDEQKPDKGRTITPALPKLLGAGLKIEPVALPAEASNPGLRAFVLRDHLAAAEKHLVAAREELAKSRQQLALAEKKGPDVKQSAGPAKVLVEDDFATLNPKLWQPGSGDWQVDGGKIAQKKDGAMRAALRLQQQPPADFEARFRFAIVGGQTYYSVGIAFDVGEGHESLVYLTAHAPDQRVQFAYKQGGDYVYPGDARAPRKVPLKVPHEMAVRVRGSLLNVSINGEFAFAFQLPKGRQPGGLDLITFDAQARLEHFSLRTLPPDVQLVQSNSKPAAPTTVAQAKAAVVSAERLITANEQNMTVLKARAAADQAMARDPQAKATRDLAQQAARAEKEQAVLQAEVALARAEAKGVPAEVTQARNALDAARKAVANPGESYTPLAGALKTLESNLETEAARRKPFPKTSTGRRAALARWLADPRNPLTARVAVNHMWARHFGRPLVPTVFDFGRKGTPPTHPELLDWLAAEFMANGWSMKHVHRLMVTSNAYRMSSSLANAPAANGDADADNRYLWRMNPARMESQVVRDSLLYLGGELDEALGGPSVPLGQQETSKRRSLYFFHSAIERNRFLTTFDEADPLECYRRRESIIPQQALALANSQLALTMSGKIADRLARNLGEAGDRTFAREAFQALIAATPHDTELAACEKAMASWRDLYRQAPPAEATRQVRTHLVHALLNHNDFVTVR
jgi:hypothetical protein